MKIIVEQAAFISAAAGKQKIDTNSCYRPINFLIFENTSDGILIYNTLTRELLLVTKSEYSIFTAASIEYNEALSYYIEHYFLVPLNFQDNKFHTQLQNVLSLTDQDDFINAYSILTTTDCNARCFYCCEHGQKRVDMTEETAYEVADFIIEHCKKHKVQIQWFGGEPLYNKLPIDIISDRLREADIRFKSNMISNAYLFDSETVKAAAERWNVKSVQVTLDGTRDIYNKTKAYIYKDGPDPFYKVIDSIRMLAENKISVIIRINMDLFNKANLYELVDYLHSQFSDNSFVKIYIRLLFDNTSELQINRKNEMRAEMFKELRNFEKYIDNLGMLNIPVLKSVYAGNGCIGTNRHGTIVMPGGELGMCNLKSDQEIYGDIKNGITNPKIISEFKELKEPIKLCETCQLYPRCTRLKKCIYYMRDCEQYEKDNLIINWQRMIKKTYENYKKSK